MKAVLDFIKAFFSQEWWSMFKDRPFPFIATFGLGMLVMMALYQPWILLYQERIADYNQRLRETPKETEYRKLSNRDLQIQLRDLGQTLRAFQQDAREEGRQREFRFDQRRSSAVSDTERQRINNEHAEEISRSSVQRQLQLQRLVPKLEALSTEVQIRLPLRQKQIDEILFDVIGIADTFSGIDPIGSVANSIEKLAALIPLGRTDWFSFRWQDSLFTLGILVGVWFWVLRRWALYLKAKSSPATPLPSDTVSRETTSTSP